MSKAGTVFGTYIMNDRIEDKRTNYSVKHVSMKKNAKTILAIIAVLSLLVFAPINRTKAQFSTRISIQTFYSELSPYGQWIADPEYGYVWVPDAGPRFRPYYSEGHWVMTRYGAMWVSDYSWGWAPFHYGRWVYTDYYGWVWVPDTVWGPAWVTWRWGNGYCGWAPLGPGINVNFSFGSGYSVPYDWWIFVPQRYCLSTAFYNYTLAPQRNVEYVRNTTIINNTYINNNVTYPAGPRINDVEKVIGRKAPVYDVAAVNKPGRTSLAGNAVRTYRPQIIKQGNARPPAAVTKDQFMKSRPVRHGGPAKQASQQTETRSVQQQNNNKQIMQERRQRMSQPPQQIEKKSARQQNNNKQIMQERRQQVSQPPQQFERKSMQQQNNNRQMQQERQQISQPPQQQRPQESRPGNNGKRKGNN